MRLDEFENLQEKGKFQNAMLGIGALAAAHNVATYAQSNISQPETHQAAPATKTANSDDVNTMALTMWGEARNQGEEGMRAVGHVIQNRAQAGEFGAGIDGVAHAPMQFSAWNRADPNRAKMNNIDKLDPQSEDYARWQEAQALATSILNGSDSDPTNGALWYHTTGVNPRWARNATPSSRKGSHVFYTNLS